MDKKQFLATLADPDVAKLPHPRRVELLETEAFLEAWLGSSYAQLAALFKDPTLSLGQAVVTLSGQSREFRDLMMDTRGAPGTSNFGGMLTLLHYMRYKLQGGKLFETTDALEHALLETDVGDDCPMNYFRPPYPAIYISFGETRSCPVQVWNAQSGLHILEGVYLQETRGIAQADLSIPEREARFLGIADGAPLRTLSVLIVGSPVGKANAMDDATIAFEIFCADENQTVLHALDRTMACYTQNKLEDYLQPPHPQEHACARAALAHAAKVLLYLNCENARTQTLSEYTDLAARIRNLGPAKAAKAERRLRRIFDRIRVGPASFAQPAGPRPGGSGEKGPHWRRGFFRQQPYGQERAMRKLRWIERVLVRADRLGAEAAPTRSYVVTTNLNEHGAAATAAPAEMRCYNCGQDATK